MIDLHLHSLKSDGTDTPEQIVDKAIDLKIKAIALTDHDTIDGLSAFLSYAETKDIIALDVGIHDNGKDWYYYSYWHTLVTVHEDGSTTIK